MLVSPWVVSANDELLRLQQDAGQWALPSKNYSATRYSALNQIKANNVKKLKHVWSFSTGVLRGHEGQPLVVGTTMYLHSAFPTVVYALDLEKYAKDPKAVDPPIKWKFTPAQDDQAIAVACCDLVHRGVNYVDRKILFSTLDGRVIALNAETGQIIWTSKAADPLKGETMTMAGLVIKDKYIVGVSGGEFGVRGWVAAYNINSGQLVWKAFSTGPDVDLNLAADFNAQNPQYGRFGKGTDTWPGDIWKIGGGTTWGWYSYDPELNLLYYSTGNPGSWNPTPRQGDNKWSTSIFARNPDTGEAKWALQMTPFDTHDFDGINEHILVNLTIASQSIPALVHFDRNGFAYTLDRRNGTILVAEPFVYQNWARGIDKSTGRPDVVLEKQTQQGVEISDICPSALGGKSQQPAAFSPRTRLFYVPTSNMCMDIEGIEVQYTAGQPYVGAVVQVIPNEHTGSHLGEFIAWDAATGRRRCVKQEKFPVWSGVLATGGDVVFYATLDGWLRAVDAEKFNGTECQVVWEHKLSSGSVGNPITYLGPDGKQYVAIYAGVGGRFAVPLTRDIPPSDPTGALGVAGIMYDSQLDLHTNLGGVLHVFALD
jgi:alcohol dehydrogenase (cytochrome c)/methanol dehydrogenase (cytochrome c) subunit 1